MNRSFVRSFICSMRDDFNVRNVRGCEEARAREKSEEQESPGRQKRKQLRCAGEAHCIGPTLHSASRHTRPLPIPSFGPRGTPKEGRARGGGGGRDPLVSKRSRAAEEADASPAAAADQLRQLLAPSLDHQQQSRSCYLGRVGAPHFFLVSSLTLGSNSVFRATGLPRYRPS